MNIGAAARPPHSGTDTLTLMFATGARSVRLLAATTAMALLALTGCSDGEPPAMPDVVGKTLDVGLVEIEDSGFSEDAEVVGGGVFGVVDEANWLICDQQPSAGAPIESAPTLTVDRECGDSSEEVGDPTEVDTDTAEEPAGAPEPAPAEASYTGPPYEVVITDENVTPANLTQYWVVIAPVDLSTDAYKDAVKAIITDLARKDGKAEIMVDVVTSLEIARAASPSATPAFIEEYGEDYFLRTIPELEVDGYIASYAGGFDDDSLEPSTSAEAYEIVWRPAASPEFETWKP